MSFDPSVYYQHGAIAGPDQTQAAPAVGPETLNDHINSHNGIKDTQAIGTSVIVTYNDGSSEVLPREVFGTTATSAGSGNALGYAQLANTQANQQASLAETIRQYNEQQGMDKAMFNIKQQFAQAQEQQRIAENNRDYSSAEHWRQVAAELNQQKLQLDQRTEGFNEYTTLANLASNPRNYVQTFFMNRGEQAPPGVAAYGNTSMKPTDIKPFSQWQQSMGYGQPAQPSASAPTASAAPGSGMSTAGIPNQVYVDGKPTPTHMYEPGTNRYLGTMNGGPTPVQDPNQPGGLPDPLHQPTSQGAGLSLLSPDQQAQIAQSIAATNAQNQPKPMANGGQYTMYVPHALVNLVTGKTEVIAGEAGKETASFDGKALASNGYSFEQMNPNLSVGGTPATDRPTTPPPSNGYSFEQMNPSLSTPGGTPATDRPAPSTPPNGHSLDQMNPNLSVGGTSYGGPTPYVPSAYDNPSAQTGRTFNDMNPTMSMTPADQARAAAPGTASPPPPAPVPLNSLYPSNPTGALGAFQHDNMVPPFLSRIFEQNRGNPAFGTNTPQRSAFPPEVPLVSGMAYNQMSPSEQQAFLSYVSSYGVDPNDYLNQISASNPRHSYLPRYLTNQQNYTFNPQ